MTVLPEEPLEEPEVVPSGDPDPILTPEPGAEPAEDPGDPSTEDSTGVEGDIP